MSADLDTFKTFMDIPETDDSQNEILNLYLNAVYALFNSLSGVEFGDTASTYTHEAHSGKGEPLLWLKHKPVVTITEISSERIPAIKIRNTSSDAARATIDVDVSAHYLYYTIIGGTNATARTGIDLTAAATDTMAELIAVINALDNGWDAVIYDTALNSIPSTELVEVKGLNCGVPRGGGDATYKELDIPGTPLDGYRIEIESQSQIYLPGGWPKGVNNIFVSYTAGYTTGSSGTLPDDLSLGILIGAQALYVRGEEQGFGASSFSSGSLRVNYGKWLPDYSLEMLSRYSGGII